MEKKTIKNHTRVTTYMADGHKFEILKTKDIPDLGVQYFAIDHEYIDENWKTTKELGCADLYLSDSLAQCIDRINMDLEAKKFAKKHRCSKFVALMAMNGKVTLKQAKKLEKDLGLMGVVR